MGHSSDSHPTSRRDTVLVIAAHNRRFAIIAILLVLLRSQGENVSSNSLTAVDCMALCETTAVR